MTWAPAARDALVVFFTNLAAQHPTDAEALQARLDDALRRADGGSAPHDTLLLPDGRALHRIALPPLVLIYERVPRGLHILLVDTT